ncbi:MAG: recombinase XerD, partial [Candidatus Sumerlaeia bacterium]
DQTSTAIYARLDLEPVRRSVETATGAMLESAGVRKPARIENVQDVAEK